MLSLINTLCKISGWIKSRPKETAIITLSVLLACSLVCNETARRRYERSITDISDTVSVYRTRNGELRKSAESYVVSLAELKRLNSDLYDEVRNLRAKPLVVTKTEYVTEIDTLYIKADSVTVGHGGAAEFGWSHSDRWTSVSGVSSWNPADSSGVTRIDRLSTRIPLRLSVVENGDGGLDIVAGSDCPYADVRAISGAVVSPERIKAVSARRSRWGVSATAGYGAAAVDGQVRLAPYAGIGISYNLITF